MENLENNKMVNRSGSVTVGVIIVFVGLALLLKNFTFMPYWLFRWHTALILIGLIVGSRNHFRTNGWLIIVLVGAYFTLNEMLDSFDIEANILPPLLLLFLGLFMIAKPRKFERQNLRNEFWPRRKKKQAEFQQGETTIEDKPDEQSRPQQDTFADYSTDYVNAVNIFGATQQIVYSKNLQGGEVTSIFGGGDINLTQADFQKDLVLTVTAVFGGVKLVVPATWQIRTEVSAIFGGVEDKRGILPIDQNPEKVVILRGLVMFGGLEIKSF